MSKTTYAMAVFIAIFVSAIAPRASAQTTFQVCHSGGPPVYAVIYETYRGLFQTHKVSGWYALKNGGCVRELLQGRDIRAFAFAAFDENNQLVALPLKYRAAGFSGSVETVCIPVEREFEAFEISSRNKADVTAPCPDGRVPLYTSFSILGGTADQTIRMEVEGVSRLPAPDAGYARAWNERFGAAAAEAAALREKQQAAAREELRRRQSSQVFVLKELEKTCGPVSDKAIAKTIGSMPYRDGDNYLIPLSVFELSCGTKLTGGRDTTLNRPPLEWRKMGGVAAVCDTHKSLVFVSKAEERLRVFRPNAEKRCRDLIDDGNGMISRAVRALTGAAEDYERCVKEMALIERCERELASSRTWLWDYLGIKTQ